MFRINDTPGDQAVILPETAGELTTVDVSFFVPGVYFYQVKSENRAVKTGKLVIE